MVSMLARMLGARSVVTHGAVSPLLAVSVVITAIHSVTSQIVEQKRCERQANGDGERVVEQGAAARKGFIVLSHGHG